MSSFQRITILGNAGSDPEVREVGQDHKLVANFNVAINEGYGDRKTTLWLRVIAWEKLAEVAEKYLHKGDQVLVDGRLQVRTYDDKDGAQRTSVEVIANNITLIGGQRDRDGGGRRDDRRDDRNDRGRGDDPPPRRGDDGRGAPPHSRDGDRGRQAPPQQARGGRDPRYGSDDIPF